MDVGSIIPSLSSSISMNKLQQAVGIKMVETGMEQLEIAGNGLQKMILESSVNPNLGGNIDIQV